MILRVILLKRIAQLNAGCFENEDGRMPREAQGPWLILGHFDSMYTWRPDVSMGFFNAVRETGELVADLNSGTAYFHPIYLIDEKNNDSDTENGFWNTDSWFISVERIHFAQPIYSEGLADYLAQKLYEDVEIFGCQIRVYRTMELSDLVVAIRSNRMDNLLNFSLSLQKYTCIGKMYTYVGISYPHLRTKEYPEDTDKIPMLSMRFSVSQFEDAMALLQSEMLSTLSGQQGDIYSVTGVDDLAVNWTQFPVSKLISLYQSWFLPNAESPETTSSLGNAFWEITSRVGIQVGAAMTGEQCKDCDRWYRKWDARDTRKILLEACTILVERQCNPLSETLAARGTGWYQPLAELTKSLVRLCQTPVLDELVFLLLPGASAFIKNLAACSSRALSEQETEKCNYFVEKWSQLMEHMIRMEGQLTQYPDMRPILYSIPIAMLEYMMAFVNQVTRILQGEQTPGHSFLLVPQMEQGVHALEMFIPNRRNGIPGLVVVTLPLRTLYDPTTVQMELCHEICHFVGEEHRMRQIRIDCFAHAAAVLIAKIIFGTYHDNLIDVIKVKICQQIQAQCWNAARPPIIREMYQVVMDWIDQLFIEESQEYSKLLLQFLENIQKNGGPPYRLETEINDAVLLYFNGVLRDISILFREVYADICMMFLLDGNPDTYVKSIGEVLDNDDNSTSGSVVTYEPETMEQWGKPNQEWERDKYTEPLAIRIYATLKALGKEIPGPYSQSIGCAKLFAEINKLDSELRYGTTESNSRTIPLGSIDALIAYGQWCYQGRQEFLGHDSEVELLRKQLKKTSSSQFSYGAILAAIQKDRTAMVTELTH